MASECRIDADPTWPPEAVTAVETLLRQVNRQKAEIEELGERLKASEHKGRLNSSNSSLPPSTDRFSKPRRHNLRERSGRKPGGQRGHQGHSIALPHEADRTVDHIPAKCVSCPNLPRCSEEGLLSCSESRYVIDVVVNTDVTEHRLFKASSCPLGGQDGSGRVSGEFPERVSGPVQYGASVRSLASTLYAYGCVSYDRCSKIMRGLMGVSISPGTVASMVAGLAEDVEPSLDSIRHGLTNGSSCHFDETVVDLGGGRAYVINASSSLLTYQTVSLTRSIEGLRSNGVVQDFRGTAIHDCYSGYWGLFESHAVCCVHIIRELKGIMDLEPEHSWPRLFLIFLRDMKKARDNALEGGQNALPAGVLEEFDQRYDRIMNLAGRECPETIQVSARKSCKNVGKERALVSRLARRKAAVCMFAHDFSVDFDNNQAERDQRYVKTKNKVSGTFRTEKGARDYVAVMSYVSTSLKHGMSASEAIERAIRKDPPIFT